MVKQNDRFTPFIIFKNINSVMLPIRSVKKDNKFFNFPNLPLDEEIIILLISKNTIGEYEVARFDTRVKNENYFDFNFIKMSNDQFSSILNSLN